MPISSDDISALRASFETLHQRRRSLIATLRASMDEIHSHSERLRQESRLPATTDGSAPTRVTAPLQREYGMTEREVEVAWLLAEGLSNAVLAQRLGISPHTARHHTQRVLGKLGVHSRAEAGARLRGPTQATLPAPPPILRSSVDPGEVVSSITDR
jgi:DNA-binding CsgD family transcriptional regulator